MEKWVIWDGVGIEIEIEAGELGLILCPLAEFRGVRGVLHIGPLPYWGCFHRANRYAEMIGNLSQVRVSLAF